MWNLLKHLGSRNLLPVTFHCLWHPEVLLPRRINSMSLNFSTTNLSNLKQCCTTWYSVLVIPMSVFLWPLSQKEKNFLSGFEPASLNNKDLFNTSATQPKVVKRVKLITCRFWFIRGGCGRYLGGGTLVNLDVRLSDEDDVDFTFRLDPETL